MAPNLIEKIADALHIPAVHKPIFDNEKVTVIFVLGGPGAGVCSVPLRFFPLFFSPPSCRIYCFMQEKERSAAFS
jgi:hypothetical protein